MPQPSPRFQRPFPGYNPPVPASANAAERDPDDSIPFPPPGTAEEEASPAAKVDPAACGFCRHRIFGRGKVVEQLPPDKCRVNFPGLGLKVIIRDFLTFEDE